MTHKYPLFLLCFMPSLAIAFSFSEYVPPYEKFVTRLSTGIALSNDLGTNQIFPILDPDTEQFYAYMPDKTTKFRPFVDAFFGFEFAPLALDKFEWQSGFNFHQTSPFLTKGIFIQGADDGSLNTFRYNYKILTRQFLFENKMLYTLQSIYHPYISTGLGLGLNNASGFSTDNNPILTRLYQNRTSHSFSYQIGFGIENDVSNTCRVGIGYRYADMGNASLGQAIIDRTEVIGTLSQPHLHVSEVMLSISLRV
jgi:opacity protein-like surface antigen